MGVFCKGAEDEPGLVEVCVWPVPDDASLKKLSEYVESYVRVLLGEGCEVHTNALDIPPPRKGKFRPIRREFAA